MLLLISGVLFGKCPRMNGYKYSVDSEYFKTYMEARNYIKGLKKQENKWMKLNVSKVSEYAYQTYWETELEHGFFCVCPPCRKKFL